MEYAAKKAECGATSLHRERELTMIHPEEIFMAQKVTLDALIARDDFEIVSTTSENEEVVFSLPELEARKGTFRELRKPIFQRETNDWSPRQIVDLVKSFMDRDLIPSVIIWHSGSGHYFIMDGAHRLSALIAWVNDDYGNGSISQRHYGAQKIGQAQKDAHDATKSLIKEEVGEYAHLLKVNETDGFGTDVERERARGLSNRLISIQRYTKADARKAEASFYRINQGGTQLDEKEREIIRTRRWPESIAIRSIWRAGDKNHYSPGFRPEVVKEIEDLAESTSKLLFLPEIDSSKLLIEVPLIGTGKKTAGMGIVDQFVHLANDLPERTKPQDSFATLPKDDPKNDETGERTIEFLKKARRLASTIACKEAHSLGLHAGVYSYSKAGKFLPNAFFAQVLLVQWLLKTEKLDWFIKHRKIFEDFLVLHKEHISALGHEVGSRMKSAPAILRYWQFILAALDAGNDPLAAMVANNEYGAIANLPPQELPKNTKVTKGSSMALKLRASLKAAQSCPECGARIYNEAWQHGHNKSASSGGSGHSDNLDAEHPYCNTGHKTRREHLAKKAAQQPQA